jgi:Zn-dependent peptidase ImmA (M78 family)
MGTLERGFKSWAERTALAFRRELRLAPHDPLKPESLAEHLGIVLYTPYNIDGIPKGIIRQLIDKDPWGWSAVSFEVNGQGLVIYNPRKSSGRRSSDITHELAHFILHHQPAKIILSLELEIGMRSFDQKQEDEANWLAWCLLLPREALMAARTKGLTTKNIAEEYGVAVSLVNMRMRLTGVDAQMVAAKRLRGGGRRRLVQQND